VSALAVRSEAGRAAGGASMALIMTPAQQLPRILEDLRSGDDVAKEEALSDLAQIMDTSYGDDAEALCEYLRVAGGVKLVAQCLASPDPAIHQSALLLIGNLASEAVDPNASATKALLKRFRAFERMLAHLFSSDWMTLVYALGAVQNTCTEIDYVELMQEMGAVQRLQELVHAGDAQLEQYAKGCLANMRQTILVAATKRQMEMQIRSAASIYVQNGARRWLARQTVNKLRKERLLATVPESQKKLLTGFGLAPTPSTPAPVSAAASQTMAPTKAPADAVVGVVSSQREMLSSFVAAQEAEDKAAAAALPTPTGAPVVEDEGAGALGPAPSSPADMPTTTLPTTAPPATAPPAAAPLSAEEEAARDRAARAWAEDRAREEGERARRAAAAAAAASTPAASTPAVPAAAAPPTRGLPNMGALDPTIVDPNFDLTLLAVTAAQNARVREKMKRETADKVAMAESSAMAAMEAATRAAEQAMEAARRAESAANEAIARAEAAELRAREEEAKRRADEDAKRQALQEKLDEQRKAKVARTLAAAKAAAAAAEQKRIDDEEMARVMAEHEAERRRMEQAAADEKVRQQEIAAAQAEAAAELARRDAEETARQAAAKEAARVEAEREEERREAARLAAELAAAAEEAARLAAEKAMTPEMRALREAEAEAERQQMAAALAAAEAEAERMRQMLMMASPLGMPFGMAAVGALGVPQPPPAPPPPPDVSDEERARIRAREAAAKILATMPPTKLDRLEMCHDLFDCVDRNGNGRIDYEEFLAQYPDEVIERWPPQMHQQMALNFRRIDRDGDSSIQRDEFVAWRLEVRSRLSALECASVRFSAIQCA
jgi:hypothetical protein